MQERFRLIKLIFILFIIIIDLYTFKGIYGFIKQTGSKYETTIYIVYWFITLLFILVSICLEHLFPKSPDPSKLRLVYRISGFFIALYLPKLVFSSFYLLEDISFLAGKLYHLLVNHWISPNPEASAMARIRLISITGMGFSLLTLLFILHGIFFGRYNYTLENISITYPNLPKGLEELRLIHISDIHLGGMNPKNKRFYKTFQIIANENPDLILFSGDMVNNFAEEAAPWVEPFKTLSPDKKKYAILGNHDYSEYFEWDSEEERVKDVEKLIAWEKEMGFNILLNQHDIINYKGTKIAIVGIENWGLPPFKQYGDLSKAMEGLDSVDFTILLSHDPTHWDEEVKEKTAIDLTLSGHTHAMQLGINCGGIKWSPSKFFYPKWHGLYRHKSQYLYVNRGLGSIGFPGRIGMSPEITVITLEQGNPK